MWLLNEDKDLGPIALEQLSDRENRILVSYFSLFEIVIKAGIGKMTYDDSVLDDLSAMDIELVSPSREHLRQYRVFNPANKDLFDNILLAVALSEECELVTGDDKILTTTIEGLKLEKPKRLYFKTCLQLICNSVGGSSTLRL